MLLACLESGKIPDRWPEVDKVDLAWLDYYQGSYVLAQVLAWQERLGLRWA